MSSRVLAIPASVCLLLAVAGCNPALNWREVRPEATRLALLLPCKPDKAQKQVPLGGQATTLSMQGCDAGDATFAVAVATLPDATRVADVLAQWQAATLANMKAAPGSGRTTTLRLSGVNAPAQAVLVSAQGQRTDGTVVHGQAAYFADGAQVFQAVMYTGKVNAASAETAETFFSSLRFE